jgi:uncharacterized repeat protein (TIGR03803 family)
MQSKIPLLLILTFILLSVLGSPASTYTVLYSFAGGTDGSNPYQAGVIFDQSGNLYGVTQNGGLYGDGTIFQLTPSPSGGFSENILYSFNGPSDGAQPQGGLILDGSGNLYGTTSASGPGACGTLFQLSPSAGVWTYTILHAFTGNGDDGCMPQGDLFGFIYGTTARGGQYEQGTVYSISTTGSDYAPVRFNLTDGSFPTGIGFCKSWGICGTTYQGGVHDYGTVYLWQDVIGNGVDPTAIVDFNDRGKAAFGPIGNVASDGWNMYVTTAWGGSRGWGGVFQLKPKNKRSGGIGFHSVPLHVFTGVKGDGSTPWAGVILDSAGNVYGTTMYGESGSGNGGTVFKLTPGAKKWNETILYSFTGGADGSQPTGSIIFDAAGNIYGTTYQGGAYGQGVVYEVTP